MYLTQHRHDGKSLRCRNLLLPNHISECLVAILHVFIVIVIIILTSIVLSVRQGQSAPGFPRADAATGIWTGANCERVLSFLHADDTSQASLQEQVALVNNFAQMNS